MSMTMEQVVTQLQEEPSALCAQVAAESGLADAVREIDNLAKAQVGKDTLSLIVWDIRRNSLAEGRIFNSGRSRRRHASLV